MKKYTLVHIGQDYCGVEDQDGIYIEFSTLAYYGGQGWEFSLSTIIFTSLPFYKMTEKTIIFSIAEERDIALDSSDYNMLKSCFAYGEYGETYEGDAHYGKIIKKYGKKDVLACIAYFKMFYRVEKNVYTDNEDCTYNSLVRI